MRLRRRFVLILGMLALLGIRAGAGAQETPERLRDIIYARKVGVALTMDIFKPAKPNGIGVIWMVSGGWVSNHDNIHPGLAKAFTDRGQTVFQVVHGSQPKFTVPEIVQDIHRAVRFIRAHAAEYGVDPNRLGISGASAGGHLSLMMGAYGAEGKSDAKDPVDRASSKVQAVACFFPPTDLLNYGKEGQNALQYPLLRPYLPAFGVTDKSSMDDLLKLGRSTSPMYGDLKSMPPTLIIHGDADKLVPIQQSETLLAKLKECKVPHKLEVRKGRGHEFWPGFDKDIGLLADWFNEYLGKK